MKPSRAAQQTRAAACRAMQSALAWREEDEREDMPAALSVALVPVDAPLTTVPEHLPWDQVGTAKYMISQERKIRRRKTMVDFSMLHR